MSETREHLDRAALDLHFAERWLTQSQALEPRNPERAHYFRRLADLHLRDALAALKAAADLAAPAPIPAEEIADV